MSCRQLIELAEALQVNPCRVRSCTSDFTDSLGSCSQAALHPPSDIATNARERLRICSLRADLLAYPIEHLLTMDLDVLRRNDANTNLALVDAQDLDLDVVSAHQ